MPLTHCSELSLAMQCNSNSTAQHSTAQNSGELGEAAAKDEQNNDEMTKQWQCVPNVAHPNYHSQQQKPNERMLLLSDEKLCLYRRWQSERVSEWKNAHRHRLWPIYSYLIEYICMICAEFRNDLTVQFVVITGAPTMPAQRLMVVSVIYHIIMDNERTDLIRIVWIFFFSLDFLS